MIHLYALTRGLSALPERTGVGGAELRSRRVGAVTAVVSAADSHGDSSQDAIAHGLVVEELLELAQSVLPVRFGQRFADEPSLAEALAPKLPALERRLDRLSSYVEVGVRVLRSGSDRPTHAADGAGYLRARLAALTDDDAVIRSLDLAVGDLARDRVVSSVGESGAGQHVGYLVRRDDTGELARRVGRYAAAHRELTVLCTGPWAPYSFAGEA